MGLPRIVAMTPLPNFWFTNRGTASLQTCIAEQQCIAMPCLSLQSDHNASANLCYHHSSSTQRKDSLGSFGFWIWRIRSFGESFGSDSVQVSDSGAHSSPWLVPFNPVVPRPGRRHQSPGQQRIRWNLKWTVSRLGNQLALFYIAKHS